MPILASSIEGQIVFLVIAGIIGLINWLTKKNESGSATPTPQARPPQTDADAEAERMRKFMEALGLPADQAPKPIRRTVTPRAKAAPPLPRPRPRPLSLDEAPAPSLPVEQLHVPELRTPELPEFHTTSSEVSAIPTERTPAVALDPYAAAQRQSPVDELRRLLRSPSEIRSAILLREILGTPRGLQS